MLLALAAILFIGAVLVALELTHVINLYSRDKNNTDSTNGINFDPPTEEEQQAGDDKKQEIVEETEQPTPEPIANNVSVVIVDANQYGEEVEVRAFANTLQDGTCKISFTKDSYKIEKQVNAFADASTTPCMNLVVPSSEFPETGTWSVSVTYSSTNKSGKADTSVEIK